MNKIFIVAFLLILQGGLTRASDLDAQIQTQYQLSKDLMFKNISRPDTLPGVVVASPSTQDPNYFFHWIRDAALTMDTVVELYAAGEGDKNSLRKMIVDYISLSHLNQVTPNLSGGLGEPKFNVDGSAFNDPWGRPQSDGPALRAIALIHFAHLLLKNGEKDLLAAANTVIKTDLDYISKSWRQSCFDLWEETRGNHFYTLMVQRKALIEGAKLSRILGDNASAVKYEKQKIAVSRVLKTFWNADQNFIFESKNQAASHPKIGLDVAIVLAVLHGYDDDGFFRASNAKILSTAMKLKESFSQIYKINADSKLAPAIGRYPEDRYNGDGDSQGNPWFLTTLAYAELCYRVSADLSKSKLILINTLNKSFFDFVTPGDLKLGQLIHGKDPLFKKIILGLQSQGDHFFSRALSFAGSDGSMSEEINRDTGVMQGARNLTWSHVSLIRAARWRKISNAL